MRLALVDGHRREAAPDLIGQCPGCGSLLISKCGDHRVWHWAHREVRHCDHWWEPETEWHTSWKNRFPVEWQEQIRWADDGEKHIADVMTPDRRVVEFQHSPLSSDERRARETFYRSMAWVVDGLARKRDQPSFEKTRRFIHREPLVYSGDPIECALLRDWVGRPVDVFFDFGEREEDIAAFRTPVLWHLHPDPGHVFLVPIPTADFIEAVHKSLPFQRIRVAPVAPQATVVPSLAFAIGRHPAYFQQYMWRRARARRRF
jgi:competence protein CoiA